MSTFADYICAECDHEFEVEVDYKRGARGVTFGPPESCYPDEPDEFSIIGDETCPKFGQKINEDALRDSFIEKVQDDKNYEPEDRD